MGRKRPEGFAALGGQPNIRIELNVRFVNQERCDFRKNDVSLFREFSEREPHIANSLRDGDAVVFVSRLGTRMSFVFGRKAVITTSDGVGGDYLQWHRSKVGDSAKTVVSGRSPRVTVIMASLRLWITGGRWEARMLVEYAESAGIVLRNRKRFEDFLVAEEKRRQEEKASDR